MDSRLFMEIGINNDGDLEVMDQTPYERWVHDGVFDADHQVLERIILSSGDDEATIVMFSDIHGISPDTIRHNEIYELPGNGLYHYQKLVIPTYEHTKTHENEFLYYKDGAVYFINADSRTSKKWENLAEDLDEIYSYVINYRLDNCFHFDDDSFSMYDLLNCYVDVESERLRNYLKNNCNEVCKISKDLDNRADILLSAVMVIRDLMDRGDFFEAQRILNGLDTCGHLCENAKTKLKGCGCGRA